MDITLIKTFLEVAATGSFVAASDRLYVTQSAVSLRIQRLEDGLGRPLFTRSKSGAVLTSAGREFEQYALSLTKIWEEARQQIGIPEGYSRSLTIAAQYSLWPRLGFRWIDEIRKDMPELSLRAEIGMPDRLTRFLIEGVAQVALMYTPQMRPGLRAEKLVSEELVLVAPWRDSTLDLKGRYAFIDWGPEFVQAHALHFRELTNPGLTLSFGALGAEYILERDMAAYLPARYVKRHIDAGKLHLVPSAPVFPYPVWSVWREDLEAGVTKIAQAALVRVTAKIDEAQTSVLQDLADLNESGGVAMMGDQVDL